MGPEFPPELVEFGPASKQSLLAGTEADTWDHTIRERGWIMREGDNWYLWYTGYNDKRAKERFLGYATSTDGLKWTRSKDNPLTSEGWVEDMCVVKHGDTYYMFAENRNVEIVLLTSKDRIHWQNKGDLDIRRTNGKPSSRPVGTPAVWVEGDTWWLLYEISDLAIYAATSKDLKTWTNVTDEPVLARGPEDYDRYAVAVNQIIKHNGRYYAYYTASPSPKRRGWNTCVAMSEDLVHWKKYPGNPILPVNPNVLETASGIVVHDGTLWRLYTMHLDVRAYFPKAQKAADTSPSTRPSTLPVGVKH